MTTLHPGIALALLALIGLTSAPIVRGDVVTLSNGDRISGKVLSSAGSSVSVETPYAGTVKIDRSQVVSISRDEVTSTEKVKPSVEEVMVSDPKNPSDAVIPVDGDPIDWQEKREWSGQANVALKIENGSEDVNELDADMKLKWRRGIYRFRFQGDVEYDTNERIATKQDWFVFPRADRYFNDRLYGAVQYGAQQEKFSGLDLRQFGGIAVGYDFVTGEPRHLVSELGFFRFSEDYVDRPDNSYTAPGWAIEFRQVLIEERVAFYHNHFAFLDFEEADKQVFRSWTGFEFPVYGGMVLSTELEMDYDSQPALRADTLDTTLRFKFGYKW